MELSLGLLGFLIVFPLIVAAVLLFVRHDGPRRVIVCAAAAVIAAASVALVVMNLGTATVLFSFESEVVDFVCTGISALIAAVIIAFGVRYKNALAIALAAVCWLLAIAILPIGITGLLSNFSDTVAIFGFTVLGG